MLQQCGYTIQGAITSRGNDTINFQVFECLRDPHGFFREGECVKKCKVSFCIPPKTRSTLGKHICRGVGIVQFECLILRQGHGRVSIGVDHIGRCIVSSSNFCSSVEPIGGSCIVSSSSVDIIFYSDPLLLLLLLLLPLLIISCTGTSTTDASIITIHIPLHLSVIIIHVHPIPISIDTIHTIAIVSISIVHDTLSLWPALPSIIHISTAHWPRPITWRSDTNTNTNTNTCISACICPSS
mmetsp:Transcript_19534/g.29587  ORF Transcript_19534/g.29587 Transcript_19534/m.29587 type:complete len:240 (+) Transcript_19534:998-1717(+)